MLPVVPGLQVDPANNPGGCKAATPAAEGGRGIISRESEWVPDGKLFRRPVFGPDYKKTAVFETQINILTYSFMYVFDISCKKPSPTVLDEEHLID